MSVSRHRRAPPRPGFETGRAFADRIRRDRGIFGEIIRRTGAGVN